MSKKQSTRKRTAILAVALVATLGLGGTLAYIQIRTNTGQNIFQSSKTGPDDPVVDPSESGVGVNAVLTETLWDGSDATVTPYTDITDSTKKIIKTTYEAGSADKGSGSGAKNMLPGTTLAKNPIITNTNAFNASYPAMRVTFWGDVTGNGTRSQLNGAQVKSLFTGYQITAAGNNTDVSVEDISNFKVGKDWATYMKTGNDSSPVAYYFFYNKKLEALTLSVDTATKVSELTGDAKTKSQTTPLFTQVGIDSNAGFGSGTPVATENFMTYYVRNLHGDVEIRIDGAAIQAAKLDLPKVNTAKDAGDNTSAKELVKLLNKSGAKNTKGIDVSPEVM